MKLLKPIKNYSKSLIKRVLYIFKQKTINIVVPPQIWRDRIRVCRNCEEIDESGDEVKCGLCTCPIADKCRWASESCPKKKWFEWRKINGKKEMRRLPKKYVEKG